MIRKLNLDWKYFIVKSTFARVGGDLIDREIVAGFKSKYLAELSAEYLVKDYKGIEQISYMVLSKVKMMEWFSF